MLAHKTSNKQAAQFQTDQAGQQPRHSHGVGVDHPDRTGKPHRATDRDLGTRCVLQPHRGLGYTARPDTHLVRTALDYGLLPRDVHSGELVHDSGKCCHAAHPRSDLPNGWVDVGIIPSSGSVADSFDNSLGENLWSTIKIELLYWPSSTFAPPRAHPTGDLRLNVRRYWTLWANAVLTNCFRPPGWCW